MAQEGFKHKLAAILSAIDDKVPCILVTGYSTIERRLK